MGSGAREMPRARSRTVLHVALVAATLTVLATAPFVAPARGQEAPPVVAPPSSAPAQVAMGALIVRDAGNTAMHSHGGSAATIRSVALTVERTTPGTSTLEVESVTWLHGHCRETGWTQLEPRTVQGLNLDGGPPRPARSVLRFAAGAVHRLAIGFQPVEAYNACDRFAVRIDLRGDGARATLEVPFDVVREEVLAPQ